MNVYRITLESGERAPTQLLHLVWRGEYVMHQLLWDLFPGSKERQFLYRSEELQGAFRFFGLSQEQTAASAIFDVQTRTFAPRPSAGQALWVNRGAKPTGGKKGKGTELRKGGERP
uniref:type I-E CRISPR-associated protein Cas6/Cse3/CasE n=1 Tax=Salmonella enterica TaxID=28901 RepID=UPI00398C5F4B